MGKRKQTIFKKRWFDITSNSSTKQKNISFLFKGGFRNAGKAWVFLSNSVITWLTCVISMIDFRLELKHKCSQKSRDRGEVVTRHPYITKVMADHYVTSVMQDTGVRYVVPSLPSRDFRENMKTFCTIPAITAAGIARSSQLSTFIRAGSTVLQGR